MPESGRKKLWHSMTVLGALLIGALGGGQAVGVVPPGTDSAVSGLLDALAKVLVLVGIRRAVNPNIEGL